MEGRWDALAWDAQTGGWDVDSNVYVNPNSVEKSMLRGADTNLIRQDGVRTDRQVPTRLVRKQE